MVPLDIPMFQVVFDAASCRARKDLSDSQVEAISHALEALRYLQIGYELTELRGGAWPNRVKALLEEMQA